MQNLLIPAIAAFSVLSAGWSGVDLYFVKTTPPTIEGYATRVAPVRAGQDIRLEWHITKLTDCPGVASRVWDGEDGFRMTEAQKSTSLPKTKTITKYRFQTRIPNLAPVGELNLSIMGYFDCPDGKKYWSLGPVTLNVVD
ncbi:MAG: hypothetical protein COA96_10165 [SAR86 cluster bacterium]|uniref:Uncharacterized protein n=1 Tax=SAR86 cluster bacterium TaxID=2030880 RepID=A0A2A5AY92_9GAMM|nr:MAG: hypothetical protein COA96_10165 [SAR86 cluster bacterium]